MVMSLVHKKCAFWVNNYQSLWVIHRPFYNLIKQTRPCDTKIGQVHYSDPTCSIMNLAFGTFKSFELNLINKPKTEQSICSK